MSDLVLYCGDPHGQFNHIMRAASRLKPAAIVLLGDLEPRRALQLELEQIRELVWYVHGNHDSDSDESWERVWGSELRARNIHGRVVSLPNGTRIGGLGGVFREAVWYPSSTAARAGEPAFRTREEHAHATPTKDRWRSSHHRKHFGTIYPCEVDRLAELEADVLVCHEAPGYHPNGFVLLDSLAQAMGAKDLIHGHQHDSLDSSHRWAAQGFRTFGVGLRGITSIDLNGDATVVVPGELDEARRHRQHRLRMEE